MDQQTRGGWGKKLPVFPLIAFGVPYLMGIPLYFCQRAGGSIDIFPNAQMFYPAAAAMVALMASGRSRPLPRRFYAFYLVSTALMLLCCFGALVAPGADWLSICSIFIVITSALGWVLLQTQKKSVRQAAGLCWHGGVKAILYVVLFILLRTASVFLSVLFTGGLGEYLAYWATPEPWTIFVILLPNFFLSFLPFFGEEYGWRYYWQPRMQRRFGPRLGVVLLGVAWGLWHLPLNLFYYSTETSLQSLVSQIIACVTLGVFFAWAMLKTGNIWIPVLLHYFNNNLILVYTASSDISGQVISWADVGITLVLYTVLYLPVFASKAFSRLPQDPDAWDGGPSSQSPERA